MRIERIASTATPAAASPLREVADALTALGDGQTIRIADLPIEYTGRRSDVIRQELEALTNLALTVEYGDRARTPQSYLVTKLGRGVADGQNPESGVAPGGDDWRSSMSEGLPDEGSEA